MGHLTTTRLGLVLAVAAFTLIVSVGIAVAQGDQRARLETISEDRFAQVQMQEPVQATDYDLSWWTVDGGGATFNTGGGYSLGSTAGQPDAAIWSGGDYALAGGFWSGVAVEYRVYLPLIARGL